MNVNSKAAAVGLTLLMITSVLPPGMVGTAEAQSAPDTYTVIQGSDCWEIEPYEPYDDNPDGPGSVQPHVEVVTHTEEGGDFRNSSWDGSPTIESVMDYRYRDPEGGVHGDEQAQPWGPRPHHSPWLSEFYRKEGWEYGTYGLWNWSENQESHMFFYSGPEGDSIVMRHDKLYDGVAEGSKAPYNGLNGPRDGYMSPQPGGSAVSFVFRDLPAGEWAYMDDLYPEGMDSIYYASGEYEYDEDRHTRLGARHNDYEAEPLENYEGGSNFTAHWMWHDNGTDGGAYRGLQNLDPNDPDDSVTIEPYFDEESYHWSNNPWWYDRDEGDGITDWVIRQKGEDNNIHLDKTEPVEIRRGSQCADASLAATPSNPEAGANATLTAGEDRSGATYSWDFDGDGETDRETSSASVSHAFDDAGEQEVSVTVETSDGIRDSDSTTLEVVPNEDPTARLSVEPGDRGLDDRHIVGEQITLNASASTDNSGALAEYEWDFGDGENRTDDAQVPYSYDEPGEYEVAVTVTDSAGNTDTATTTFEIEEPDSEPPTARGDVEPDEVEAGAPLTFDGGDSDDNRGIAAYRWDFTGNDDYTAPTSNETLEAAPYESAGNYTATLLVVDGNGNTNTTTVPVTVTQARAPNVTEVSVQDDVSAGEEFEVSAEADDPSGIASVTYSFSDDESQTVEPGESVTHSFESPGSASVTVAVQDRAGNTNSTEPIPINVTQAPAADLSLTTNGTAPNGTQTGETVTFDASGSDDTDGNVVEYRWDFDGDDEIDRTTNESERVVTHEYDSGGTYDAAVTVVDNSDLTDTATAQIEVEGDDDDDDEQAIGGGGGGGVSVGPPPVDRQTEQTGPNSATIDVRNARGDEAVRSDLPSTEVADETGVDFRSVAVDLASDNPHVVFETAASADRPGGVAELSATHETLAYLQLDGQYLGSGVESAAVEFEVERSAIGGLAEPGDVVVYQYDGAWTQVNASVVEEGGDTYRLAATADGLGTLAVGTDQSLTVADAGLETDAVATGESLTANVTVENTGETAQMGTVELALGENVVATETVEVAPAETAEVTLRGTAPATGTYEATVGGVSMGELDVLETRPADVSVAGVSVNESTIAAGERVAITATVENSGGQAGEETVNLTLFGEELDSETVRVEGGETTEVTFVRQIDAAGTYTAEVGGETAEVEVTDSGSGDLGDAAPDVPGFGVGAALVALLAAALLARLRS